MQCLRCKTKMKHYNCTPNLKIVGAWHKPNQFSPEIQLSHNIHSVYICEQCGYSEFNVNPCENPDI